MFFCCIFFNIYTFSNFIRNIIIGISKMYKIMAQIQEYLRINNYEVFATLLQTNKARITYLCGKATKPKKFKKSEIEILVNNFYFNEEWLINGTGEMINYKKKKINEFVEEFTKLPENKKDYFLHLIKAENIKNEENN